MKRNFISKGMMGAAIALGALGGTGQVASALAKALADNSATAVSYKATKPTEKKSGAIGINSVGGLDLPPMFPKGIGMTPKEYGMRYSNGGSKRSNKLRYSHNAKVKRRNS